MIRVIFQCQGHAFRTHSKALEIFRFQFLFHYNCCCSLRMLSCMKVVWLLSNFNWGLFFSFYSVLNLLYWCDSVVNCIFRLKPWWLFNVGPFLCCFNLQLAQQRRRHSPLSPPTSQEGLVTTWDHNGVVICEFVSQGQAILMTWSW